MTASTTVDANIYRFVCRYLDWAQAHPPATRRSDLAWMNDVPDGERHARLGSSNFALSVTLSQYDYMNTTGGLTVFMWGTPPDLPDLPVINLGLAHDISDATTAALRDPIVAALTDRGIPFIPVSWGALRHAVETVSGHPRVHLVDRDGLQCVLRLDDTYFISGYDANETPPLYFVARLPGPVDTYAEALESLKPRSVKVAEAQGIRVLRQGDMFAIHTTYRSHDLRAMGAVFGTNVDREIPRPPRFLARAVNWRVIMGDDMGMELIPDSAEPSPPESPTMIDTRRRGLYGTAHTARELAYLPDGTMFARGAIVHDPRAVLHEHRDPDHSELPLPGRTWYLVARNTVPIQGGG